MGSQWLAVPFGFDGKNEILSLRRKTVRIGPEVNTAHSLLAFVNNHHVEPLVTTRGSKKCGLLTLGEAKAKLGELGVAVVGKGSGIIDLT